MKIQYLAVVFIIITMPIVIVFSEYINTQSNIIRTEQTFDERLFNSTYDTIKAFQLNTINSMYYTPQSRVKNIEAAVNTFFNSLTTSFQYDGNLSTVMKEYVPAVVFTMYDGYYIFSPFDNTLTGVKEEEVDDEYKKSILSGLKPYVSYSCRYSFNNKEYIITYSMDNYVYVDIFDGEKHIAQSGYLINGITKSGDKYTFDGITFEPVKKDIKETYESLREYVRIDDNEKRMYNYVSIDGTKYYYDNNNTEDKKDDYIFYIDEQKEKHRQVVSRENNEAEFDAYLNKMLYNDSAYLYYKEAYEFTTWLLKTGKKIDIDGDGELDEGQGLEQLRVENIVGSEIVGNSVKKSNDDYQFDTYEFANTGSIFDGNIEYSNSNFNRHRADVIRAVITTNLSTAIAGYKKYSNKANVEFLMPKISETDWELLENNVCIATFLQGIKVGDKTYNNYAVIANNFNKEYVDENDIYILTKENTYSRVNDNIFKDENNIPTKESLGFEPGLVKINFETRRDKEGQYYNPITLNGNLYLQSYTNLDTGTGIDSIDKTDMYRYISERANSRLKKVYYTALGRERYGSFKYTINEIEL